MKVELHIAHAPLLFYFNDFRIMCRNEIQPQKKQGWIKKIVLRPSICPTIIASRRGNETTEE